MEIHIAQDGAGLGDSICGLWVAEGYRQQGYQVHYYNRHIDWLKYWHRIDKGLILKNYTKDVPEDVPRIWSRYIEELCNGMPRKSWLSKVVSDSLQIPWAEPALPEIDPKYNTTLGGPRSELGRYICIVPWATTLIRTWPEAHWHHFIKMMKNSGLVDEVILLDGPGDGLKHQHWDCMRVWGQRPEIVINLLKWSKAVVSVDTGIAHLAGLLGNKLITVNAGIEPWNIFSHHAHYPVWPGFLGCSTCRYIGDRGHMITCDMHGCSKLMALTPEAVFEETKRALLGMYPSAYNRGDWEEIENTREIYISDHTIHGIHILEEKQRGPYMWKGTPEELEKIKLQINTSIFY